MGIWYNEKENNKLRNKIQSAKITDVIRLSQEDFINIVEVYRKIQLDYNQVQRCFLMLKVLEKAPFYNFKIRYEDLVENETLPKDYRIKADTEITVVLNKDPIQKLAKGELNENDCFGYLERVASSRVIDENKEYDFNFFPQVEGLLCKLYFQKNTENDQEYYSIAFGDKDGRRIGYSIGKYNDKAERNAVNADPKVVYSTLNAFTQFIVAVMFAFLNPPKVKKIFVDESIRTKESSSGNATGKSKKKKPLEYVVHVPDRKAMERYVRTEGKDFLRHANVWSVIGHFRHYQN